MTNTNAEKFSQDNARLSHYLTQLLLGLGFQIGNLGFNYMKRVIILMGCNCNFTLSDAYNTIAKEEKKLPDTIMSSVRSGIRTAYYLTRFSLLENLLGVRIFLSNYSIPAPRELVGLINEYLRIFWNGESGLIEDEKAA